MVFNSVTQETCNSNNGQNELNGNDSKDTVYDDTVFNSQSFNCDLTNFGSDDDAVVGSGNNALLFDFDKDDVIGEWDDVAPGSENDASETKRATKRGPRFFTHFPNSQGSKFYDVSTSLA